MRLKAVSGIMLTLLFVGMLTLAFNIQPVTSEPTTIVVPDDYEKIQWAIGNASDGDTIFVRAGTYYEHVIVTKSLSLIGENKHNTIIDGNGSTACVFVWANNTKIGGFTTCNGLRGIWLSDYAHNNTVSDNIIMMNSYMGIWAFSSNNTFLNNNITQNPSYGIQLAAGSFNNFFSGNTMTNNKYGMMLERSSGNIFRNNNMTGNQYNFGVIGYVSSEMNLENDIDISNLVNGKPIYYWVNQHDMQVPSDAGYVALINCTRMTVENLVLSNNHEGILVAYTNNSIISENTAIDNELDIWLYHASNNTVSGNDASNSGFGFRLDWSSNNTVSDNNSTNNSNGIFLCWSSKHNTFSSNNITHSYYGIRFSEDSSSNHIFHNNFINNRYQVRFHDELNNTWDCGYPYGGNYWDNHVCTGNPSDGSQPYVIDGNNIDHYPFQDPNGWLIPGDVNGDGIVNIQDMLEAALAFGSYSGHPRWNPDADLNSDEIVNILDLVKIGVNFGKKLPL